MPFIDGYSAVSAQAAVRAGVDVRLVQDDAPLRPHRAHAMPDPVDIKLDYETCVRTIDKGLGAPPIDLSQGPNPKRVHLCFTGVFPIQSPGPPLPCHVDITCVPQDGEVRFPRPRLSASPPTLSTAAC